jgi:hypothetical protein
LGDFNLCYIDVENMLVEYDDLFEFEISLGELRVWDAYSWLPLAASLRGRINQSTLLSEHLTCRISTCGLAI